MNLASYHYSELLHTKHTYTTHPYSVNQPLCYRDLNYRDFNIHHVLEIAFLERSTLALLVHYDFNDKIVQLSTNIGVSIKTNFDSLDHRIITDPAHAYKPEDECPQLAYKLHRQRLLALCLRLPLPSALSSIWKTEIFCLGFQAEPLAW
ncbi:hypothetical protein J3Q64DRAFT_1837896 [Phycomyces blakesleeanus]|uniref:Uncharacterized protein n=2 Tax=Phycomyces blakesleeanus TaxID=4837 RepID=A0A167RD56_PHYB8|nr:hypothetical protein PHYBLDRAFT_138932 [Phycomyces blakesleeanus NRRL 1555(-)]OAD81384.1 hypothetical protein PHYBLDRAFT_138932 [Phycomyces blakesleeanus NRRL 1555(-)]|eukprot:XP_018299424.1 hypothetical protein PHYBLDRAFT_138932 [Phycomyces blakesleeanus NRRL 1555(-)]